MAAQGIVCDIPQSFCVWWDDHSCGPVRQHKVLFLWTNLLAQRLCENVSLLAHRHALRPTDRADAIATQSRRATPDCVSTLTRLLTLNSCAMRRMHHRTPLLATILHLLLFRGIPPVVPFVCKLAPVPQLVRAEHVRRRVHGLDHGGGVDARFEDWVDDHGIGEGDACRFG